MKKTIFTLSAIVTLAFTGCMQDETPPILEDPGNSGTVGNNTVSVSGMISESTTWTNDNIYVLNQKVVVPSGVVLTIQAGTIIKGTEGTGSLASALIVAQGGKLNAVGTATEPIIFTSINDNIEVGQTAGTNLNETNSGLWGGLIVLGYAPSSFSGDVDVVQIEGIPADDTFGLYGGEDATDNSGVYQYISIRHGGALIGEGNEINGLTLGGVGSGTVIENIEVVANVDDGIEFFGGTVNATNLLVWAQGDDAIDIDQGYSGIIDNAIVILGANSDHAFEIDGPEGTATGSFTLRNSTIIGNSVTENGEYADYRSKAMGRTENIYAYGFKSSSDVELDNDGVATNYNDGLLTFGAWEIVLPTGVSEVTDIFVNKAATVDVSGFGSTATAVSAAASTVGATTSLLSWTYANAKAELGF
ncbi:MAG: hypothetical protein P8M66_00540 [Flavobacteriaceae bacterium]|jgi:hypothetical protein|nr:hypothetical protein [Flavobacteriaceae bacterium]